MIPSEYLVAYLISNAIALAFLAMAFRRPAWVRWGSVLIFGWATFTNTRIALTHPLDYQGFAPLAWLAIYRDFITGWFREHTALLLLPIAAGQGVLTLLFALRSPRAHRLAATGACLFLLAIAPLGVGSAFPFSLTYGAALLVMLRHLPPAARSAIRGSTAG